MRGGMIKGLSECSKYLKSRLIGGLGSLAGVSRPLSSPTELPLRPMTAAHQRKRESVLSAFESIYSRPHPCRLARSEPSVGAIVEEADGIDELIGDDGGDDLDPSAFGTSVAQPEAEEKELAESEIVAPCSLAARVQRKCARCRNSWPIDQIMDSVFAAKGARRFYCSTVSEKCDRTPKH